ncbi:MAG: hypothetical protein HY606_08425 [Planctomycetes bacterium]|nr:hypothetical protein [Planctomycetota bacterium]
MFNEKLTLETAEKLIGDIIDEKVYRFDKHHNLVLATKSCAEFGRLYQDLQNQELLRAIRKVKEEISKIGISQYRTVVSTQGYITDEGFVSSTRSFIKRY